ncbi:MAG TPA: hypothetical protein VFZ83_13090 [Acidimicrobiia bacterium]|nr:hypothetical protein [Acidimicrobiia bacterium]
MLSADEILDVVERDVRLSFGGTFPPVGDGFRLLAVDGIDFAFAVRDIPEADVSFVSWEYQCEHLGAMRCTEGTDAAGDPRLFIEQEPEPVEEAHDVGTMLPPTGRPVTIVGTTVVLSRDAAEVADPVLLRFIDWSRVFSQLGYAWDYGRVIA